MSNAPSSASHTLIIDGVAVSVRIKRSPLARALSLRVDQHDGAILLVLPPHVPESRGLAFARSKIDWLRPRLAAVPGRVAFQDGAVIPFLGDEHRLTAAPTARRGVWREDGVIHVSGQPEHFARRVGDWLRDQAKAELTARALPMATAIGHTVQRIAVRDTKSRWGSCTSRGHLAFSWRLILAPSEVLAYVAAHEVAHLAEMNHGPDFWRIVGTLSPGWRAQRDWLKRHGAMLHRYG